jgi:membrane-associated protease RseP (regulator of RpoE activity)
MNFMILDISLLVLFVIFISIFLYKKRKNLKKEGIFLLYKTNHGINIINKIGNKYKKTLKVLSCICIGLGYLLMGGIIYLFGKTVWIYASRPDIVSTIKVPPIMPLFPYIPQIFKLTFLPPFYFIYWIIIIAIIAIPHEFAHGIFAAYNKVKIKSTGFGFFPFFLPVFLVAFVEQDEESMNKSSKFSQMAILAAGTFANILTAIFFFGVMFLFFTLAFTPSGVMFDTYAYSVVGVSAITMINNIPVSNASIEEIADLIKNNETFNDIRVGTERYVGVKDISEDYNSIALFYDAPAINTKLEGVITEINGAKINNLEKLSEELLKHSPGDTITLNTKTEDKEKEYKIVLEENPEIKGRAWLGIGFTNQESSGILNKIISFLFSFKKSNVYYESKFGAGLFIYNLLWWIVVISLSVAFINMLPVGIFDGGRFFYLTILAITKSEKKAKKTFSFMTYLFLFLLLLLMIFWFISFIK